MGLPNIEPPMSSIASRAAATEPGPVMAEYTDAWSFRMPILTGRSWAEPAFMHATVAKSASDANVAHLRVILSSRCLYCIHDFTEVDICQYLYMNAAGGIYCRRFVAGCKSIR